MSVTICVYSDLKHCSHSKYIIAFSSTIIRASFLIHPLLGMLALLGILKGMLPVKLGSDNPVQQNQVMK